MGGSSGSSPYGSRLSTGRATLPGWISSSPWQHAYQRKREGLNRKAESNGEESDGGERKDERGG